ncbi:hypothetical protein [Streptomyces nigrescens]|uniref:Uncharacterized protein n=1 Tax=Streptomyces nigrescens TaxID=1920 RepID=A0ABY7IXU5_STRNI|nr:hypothetical protein [Streptomyces nigrescens]WAU02346.1 hypothetical protein STRNI_000376 [Streptomyces nigrescens]
MIVRCDQIISPTSGEIVPDHPGIRIGEEYPVLEITTTADRSLLRLPEHGYNRGRRESPGLWDAAMFTVVVDRVPNCWVAQLDDGRLTLAPPEWQRLGFWEEYFDDVPRAVAEYDRLRAKILAQA